MIMGLYDISEFAGWYQDIPDNIGVDDLDFNLSDCGLRPDAPPEAVVAFEKYKADKAYADKHGIKL